MSTAPHPSADPDSVLLGSWVPDQQRQATAGYRVEDLIGLRSEIGLYASDIPGKVELRDGVAAVVPSPTVDHQEIGCLLWLWFREHARPHGYRPITDVGVQVDTRTALEPDVVLTRVPVQGNPHYLDPAEVLLVVEIVSPGTHHQDRVGKPAIYAATGIGYYWRVEQSPLRIYAYVLDGDRYRLAAEGHQVLALDEPFPMRLAIADITPER